VYKCVLFLLLCISCNILSAQDSSKTITIYPTVIGAYAPSLPTDIKAGNPLLIVGSALTYKTLYAEVRVNYDQLNTLGAYVGKMYLIEKPKLTHLFTPQLGVLIGDYRGGSFQFYYQAYHQAFEISFLNQYSVSVAKQPSFYFNWSSIDFNLVKHCSLGVSTQIYSETNTGYKSLDLGLETAFKKNNTTIQLYWFNFFAPNSSFISLFVQQKIIF
jgi:hypothetical protein